MDYKTYSGILPGPHTFKVNYIITPEEGPPIRDTTPATRTWNIIEDVIPPDDDDDDVIPPDNDEDDVIPPDDDDDVIPPDDDDDAEQTMMQQTMMQQTMMQQTMMQQTMMQQTMMQQTMMQQTMMQQTMMQQTMMQQTMMQQTMMQQTMTLHLHNNNNQPSITITNLQIMQDHLLLVILKYQTKLMELPHQALLRLVMDLAQSLQ